MNAFRTNVAIMRTTLPSAHHTRLAALRAALDTAGTTTMHRDRHDRVCPATTVRVATIWGDGLLVSITEDGWAEVRLDGEHRCDEYPVEMVELIP